MTETPTRLEALRMIAADMEQDARDFDGQPFTGRTVAEYNGKQGAAIAALATIVATLVEGECHAEQPCQDCQQRLYERTGEQMRQALYIAGVGAEMGDAPASSHQPTRG